MKRASARDILRRATSIVNLADQRPLNPCTQSFAGQKRPNTREMTQTSITRQNGAREAAKQPIQMMGCIVTPRLSFSGMANKYAQFCQHPLWINLIF